MKDLTLDGLSKLKKDLSSSSKLHATKPHSKPSFFQASQSSTPLISQDPSSTSSQSLPLFSSSLFSLCSPKLNKLTLPPHNGELKKEKKRKSILFLTCYFEKKPPQLSNQFMTPPEQIQINYFNPIVNFSRLV